MLAFTFLKKRSGNVQPGRCACHGTVELVTNWLPDVVP